jgi:hypothetical protein
MDLDRTGDATRAAASESHEERLEDGAVPRRRDLVRTVSQQHRLAVQGSGCRGEERVYFRVVGLGEALTL